MSPLGSARIAMKSVRPSGGARRRSWVCNGAPPTDIWSFGTMVIIPYASLPKTLFSVNPNNHGFVKVISMIWGDNFCIFKPNVPRGHDESEIKILAKYHIYFGPFAPSYGEPADEETLAIPSLIMKDVPPEKLRPFSLASQKEISQQDKEFLFRIMKLDPRDRPTAKDLIEDEWFNQ